MAFSVGGKINIGTVERVAQPTSVSGKSFSVVIAEQRAKQEEERAAQLEAEKTELPVDSNRPVFNSLIDRKENSRYMLDLVKV